MGAARRPGRPRRGSRSLQLLKSSYQLGSRLAERLPVETGYSLLALGGSLWYRASQAQRRNALQNYAVVLGSHPSDPRVKRVAEQAFRNYGKMLLDFVRIGSVEPEEITRRVSHDGRGHIDAALALGRGAILAVPHMGSWDMGGAAIGAYGYPTYAVAEVFPGSLNEAVVRTRERFGLHVIPLGRSAVTRIREALARNSVVALLCDLEHGPGVTVEFFGRQAVVPSGPAAFAIRTGAALLPAHMFRTESGNYHASIEPPLAVQVGPDRKGDPGAIMQAVVRRFEEYIRPRPEQWYAFKPVFRPAE